MRHYLYNYVLLFLLASLFVSSTAFIPITINNNQENQSKFGLPIPFFIIQNPTIIIEDPYSPNPDLQASFQTPQETPTQIVWHLFFIDIVVVFGILKLCTRGFKLMKHYRYLYSNTLLFFLTLIVLFTTLYVPQTIYHEEDFRHVTLGLPLPFIAQDQDISPPLPWQTSLETPRENPTRIIWHYFFIDVVVVFGILKLCMRGFKLIRRRSMSR